MMTQGVLVGGSPTACGFIPEFSPSIRSRSFRHIPCTSVLLAGDTLEAGITMAADTHPQIAHVCKGGRTGRDGP